MYYEEHFDLKEAPFSISPDPKYLYLTPKHREGLAHLLYGVSSNGGFVLLTGEIGAGKTTLCQCLLQQLPDNTDVAYILNPKLRTWEFFAVFCDEMRIPYPPENRSVKIFLDGIYKYLLKAHKEGRNTVLMVDEAQNLSTGLLEILRLLTNLETRKKKLLQIMLIGQPELREKIGRPELRQLAQRITARFHLEALTGPETAAYIQHRLKVAGAPRPIFDRESLKRVAQLAEGVPRLVNVICDRALLGAFATGEDKVNREIVDRAAGEVLGKIPAPRRFTAERLGWGLAAAALMLLAFGGSYFYRTQLLNIYQDSVQPAFSSVMPAPPKEPILTAEPGDRIAEEIAEKFAEERANFAANESVGAQSPEPQPGVNHEHAVKHESAVKKSGRVTLARAVGSPASPDLILAAPRFPASASQIALQQAGFNTLLKLWGVDNPSPAGNVDCNRVVQWRLRCYSGTGNLLLLRNLDRPVLLTLLDAADNRFPAVLAEVRGDAAKLVIGNSEQNISVTRLAEYWNGEFTLLWRTPEGYRRPLQLGDEGIAVRWLRGQLNVPDAVGRADLFENFTKNSVREFQSRSGLAPDGVAGPITLITLNNQVGEVGPRLYSAIREVL